MTETSFTTATTAKLSGLFPPEFEATQRIQWDILGEAPAGIDWQPAAPFDIANARPLQAQAESTAHFFDGHGFVLLTHKTGVQDWELASDHWDSSEAGRLYHSEIEQLVQRLLLPGRRVELLQWWGPVLRGRGTSTPGYVNAVHSDYDVTAEDYEVNVEAYDDRDMADRWRRSYERDEVEAFMMIDFWRPTTMTGPLLHMPLALCDPTSVEMSDLVPTAFTGLAPSGRPAHQVLLRYNPGQRWYYYPRMGMDEVLAFKLLECRKDDPAPSKFRNVFHSAFADPDTPADAEQRQSCEHRIGVLILRD
jgi:hypothetical protein